MESTTSNGDDDAAGSGTDDEGHGRRHRRISASTSNQIANAASPEELEDFPEYKLRIVVLELVKDNKLLRDRLQKEEPLLLDSTLGGAEGSDSVFANATTTEEIEALQEFFPEDALRTATLDLIQDNKALRELSDAQERKFGDALQKQSSSHSTRILGNAHSHIESLEEEVESLMNNVADKDGLLEAQHVHLQELKERLESNREQLLAQQVEQKNAMEASQTKTSSLLYQLDSLRKHADESTKSCPHKMRQVVRTIAYTVQSNKVAQRQERSAKKLRTLRYLHDVWSRELSVDGLDDENSFSQFVAESQLSKDELAIQLHRCQIQQSRAIEEIELLRQNITSRDAEIAGSRLALCIRRMIHNKWREEENIARGKVGVELQQRVKQVEVAEAKLLDAQSQIDRMSSDKLEQDDILDDKAMSAAECMQLVRHTKKDLSGSRIALGIRRHLMDRAICREKAFRAEMEQRLEKSRTELADASAEIASLRTERASQIDDFAQLVADSKQSKEDIEVLQQDLKRKKQDARTESIAWSFRLRKAEDEAVKLRGDTLKFGREQSERKSSDASELTELRRALRTSEEQNACLRTGLLEVAKAARTASRPPSTVSSPRPSRANSMVNSRRGSVECGDRRGGDEHTARTSQLNIPAHLVESR